MVCCSRNLSSIFIHRRSVAGWWKIKWKPNHFNFSCDGSLKAQPKATRRESAGPNPGMQVKVRLWAIYCFPLQSAA